MSEAASAPPRKPRGARRWPWVLTAALVAIAYAGSYASLRSDGTFFMFYGGPDKESFIVGPASSTWEPVKRADGRDGPYGEQRANNFSSES